MFICDEVRLGVFNACDVGVIPAIFRWLAIRDQAMAERPRQEGKKRAAKSTAPPKAEAAASASNQADRIRALEAERDTLAAELEAAKARIAALEQAREQVLNRIDWVIDSLHSLTSE